MSELKSIIEALIFASPEPVTVKALVKLLDSEVSAVRAARATAPETPEAEPAPVADAEGRTSASAHARAAVAAVREEILAAIEALKQDDDRPGGLQIVEVAGGYQIVTRSELHEWVRRLFHERTTQKLSVAALETLAVIAYRQPVTAPEVAEIRGVNTSGVLSTLIERKLIKIVGRKQVVGRPFLYGTTREFLDRFGLNDLADLPKVEDMSELLGFELPATVDEPVPQTPLPFEPEEGGGQDGAVH